MADTREELIAQLEVTKAMNRAVYEIEFPIMKALLTLGLTWADLSRISGRPENELQSRFGTSRAW